MTVRKKTLGGESLNKYETSMKEKFVEIMQRPSISYGDCLDYIDNEIKQSKRMASFRYKISCFFDDGVYQLNRAITEKFGTVVSADSFDPSGSNSTVETVDIKLADGTRVKAPYGDIALPDLGEESEIHINYDSEEHYLLIKGKCQMRYSSFIDDIVERTKYFLRNESIYKDQAIEVTDINKPLLLDLSGIDKQFIVLSDSVQYALKPILARIKNPAECIKRGVPLKFGVLMSGNYGTGKTLLAFKLAREAVSNHWIFIYLKNPSILAETLRMSKIIDRTGNGVIVFVEDIDQVTRGNRDAAMQDMLNTLDGGDCKDMNVISIFTTNHIELIEPTFLRGKRIGTVIPMGYLDAKTAKEFIEKSFEIGSYTINEDLSEVCAYIEKSNIVPAFMAEIVEKVKAVMVLDNTTEVKANDIKLSVDSYLKQVELAKTKDMSETPEIRFVNSLRTILNMLSLLSPGCQTLNEPRGQCWPHSTRANLRMTRYKNTKGVVTDTHN